MATTDHPERDHDDVNACGGAGAGRTGDVSGEVHELEPHVHRASEERTCAS